MTVRGSQPGRRYVVLADESGLTVLNLIDSTLPRAATRVLLDMAVHHPEAFAGTFVDHKVRVGPEGVFVTGRKVAELRQLVEHIARDDVAEIKKMASGADRCAMAGGAGGLLVGGLIGAKIGEAVLDPSNLSAMVLGMLGGWGAGAILGYRACRHQGEYRAP